MSDQPRAGLPAFDDWKEAARRGAPPPEGSAGSADLSSLPERLPMPAELIQELIDAARTGFPNEACGVIAGDRSPADGGQPTRFHALRNAAASPYRYLIDPDEQLAVLLAIDDADEVVWGIFHSHVASAAVPSATDVGLAYYPESLYLLCSLWDELPEVRAWWIREGEMREVTLEVA